jgi:hypothetical protein
VNNLEAGLVLAGMRIHLRNGLPEPPAGGADHTTDAPARARRWRARYRWDRGKARPAPGSAASGDQAVRVPAAPGETVAAKAAEVVPPRTAPPETAPAEAMGAAMQLAIALLTAGLDSPELEAWAADALTPADAGGLADFMAGLHMISALLLNELHLATGEPPAAILQRLAILAERQRGAPFAD